MPGISAAVSTSSLSHSLQLHQSEVLSGSFHNRNLQQMLPPHSEDERMSSKIAAQSTSSSSNLDSTTSAFKYASTLSQIPSSRAATAVSGSYSSSASSHSSHSDNSPSPVTPSSPPLQSPHRVPHAPDSNLTLQALLHPRPRRISPLFSSSSILENNQDQTTVYGLTDIGSNDLNDGGIFAFELSPRDTKKGTHLEDVDSNEFDDSFTHNRLACPPLSASLRSPYSSSTSSSPGSVLAASPLSSTGMYHLHSAPTSITSRSPAIAIALPSPRPLPSVLSRAMQLTSRPLSQTQSNLSSTFVPRSLQQPPAGSRLQFRRSSADVYGSHATAMHQAATAHHPTHLTSRDYEPSSSHGNLRSPHRPLPPEHHSRTYSGPIALHHRVSPSSVDTGRRFSISSHAVNLNSKVNGSGSSTQPSHIIVKTEDALFDLEL